VQNTGSVKPFIFISLLFALQASALDKQGGPREGSAEPSKTFDLSGSLTFGVAPYNPSYAARPDNTGIALFRYGAHVDVDLIGQYLSIPLDVNFFTDAQRPGILVLAPTEFDVIAGLSSAFKAGPGTASFGIRMEHDRPIDQGTFTQTYVDGRARYVASLRDSVPQVSKWLRGGDLSGWATLGLFIFNPTYAARPDNTGNALFRYGLHGEISAFNDLISLGLDATMFTDRQRNPLAVSELDFTADLIFHWSPFELHLAYERDMPVDTSGLVQEFVYLLAAFSFDLVDEKPRAMTDTNQIVSP
jgi:hypothetical protein